jgi:ATP-dependent helicase/nuclease subunit B
MARCGDNAEVIVQLDRLSPTQVERYASCPFHFYAKEVLGLEEED